MQLKPICLSIALMLGASVTPLLMAADAKPVAAKAVATKSVLTKASAATMYTAVEGVTEYRLTNGMRVLLAPDASKPTTTVNVTYLVGSRHESYGETGMAHLLEHMVFKGTKSRSNIMDELSKRGMQFNGTTFYDRTNYYETFPANEDNLRWALEMEADRMVNSLIAKKALDTEFSVVRNEMEIGENNPVGVLWKQLSAVTFDWHNYGHSTIGARSDVEGVKIENLQAFYRKFYQPDNAVLMVAGKFDTASTLAQIEKSFGSLMKPTRVLEKSWTREAPRDGTREITVRRVGDQQVAALLYPISAGSHADAAALSVLGDVLGSTPNGRLHKQLVETKQAVGVGNWAFELAEPGYSMYLAILSKDQDIAAAKKNLIGAVEGVAKQAVTEEELKRAKTNLLNAFEKTINDPQNLCVSMSESIAMGDWRLFFIARDRIEAVKIEDVQRVAQNYFKEDNRSFGQFLPVAKPDRAEIPAATDVVKLVDGYKGRAAVAAGETFDASTANLDKRTEKSTLANGAKLALLSKKTRGETVNGRFVLHFGNEKNLFGHSVHADLAADMLLRGTGKLSRAEIDTKLGELKAELSIRGAGQDLNINFDTVRASLPALLDLLKEVLRAPAFPASEFELLQKENLAVLESARNEPQSVASNVLSQKHNAPYLKGDIRYQDDIDASIANYSAAKLAAVKEFYSGFYGANHAELALVGDFDKAEMKAKLNAAFGDWNSPAAFARVVSVGVPAAASMQSVETADKANAMYLAELPFILKDSSPDYAALTLANTVLGGGVKSRLFERLRQKEGISYGAGSDLSIFALDDTASVTVYAMFAPQNLSKLQNAVQEEMTRFVKDGISATELADAKQALAQERSIHRAQDPAVAGAIRRQVFIGRTMAFEASVDSKIAALTLDEVNAAIRKYIKPLEFTHVYAGDFAGAAKKATKSN